MKLLKKHAKVLESVVKELDNKEAQLLARCGDMVFKGSMRARDRRVAEAIRAVLASAASDSSTGAASE